MTIVDKNYQFFQNHDEENTIFCKYCSIEFAQKYLIENLKQDHYLKGDDCLKIQHSSHLIFCNYRNSFDIFLTHFVTCLNKEAEIICNQCKKVKTH